MLDKTNQSWVVAAYFNIVSDGLVVVLFMVIELCSLGIRRKVVGRGMVGLCLVCVRVRGGGDDDVICGMLSGWYALGGRRMWWVGR